MQDRSRWLLLRLLVEPGWAPVAVVVGFLLAVPSGFADTYDWVFHSSGGAAVAYFTWRTLVLLKRAQPRARPLIALVVATGIAVLWEAAEFVADRVLGTSLQHGAGETLRDLAFGAVGAVVVCLAVLRSRRA